MPMPRKLASRMKLEKYARSRTYAGIHRISATSRKRTRNDARKCAPLATIATHAAQSVTTARRQIVASAGVFRVFIVFVVLVVFMGARLPSSLELTLSP